MTLRLRLVRVPIYASSKSPAYRESTKLVEVLSTDGGVSVVRIKGVSDPERAIAQLTKQHLLVGFRRPAKYEVIERQVQS